MRPVRLAHIHDDIVTMPMGYHSLVGDMGSTLSGGQKQRLLLARALYRCPRILCCWTRPPAISTSRASARSTSPSRDYASPASSSPIGRKPSPALGASSN